MIASFFQNLERRQVDYLLISGQATVLYGAATFSEDIDLWIDPSPENRERFVAVLRDSRARYYKLTPKFNVENLSRGHGFHFLLGRGGDDDVFLDVMGVPPRVGVFTDVQKGARYMETEWGSIHTIGLKALVALKKTQRLEDYPIISRLALAWLDQSECLRTADDFRWAVQNIFTLPELKTLFEENPGALELLSGELPPVLKQFAQQAMAAEAIPEETAQNVNSDMQRRIAALQQADRVYWRDIIADLKRLRAEDKLTAEGAEV
jgi:hypothetical protein